MVVWEKPRNDRSLALYRRRGGGEEMQMLPLTLAEWEGAARLHMEMLLSLFIPHLYQGIEIPLQLLPS